MLEVNIISATPEVISVIWSKGLQQISDGRFSGGSKSAPSLSIKSVTATDDGTYTCKIDNGVGITSVNIILFTWSK